MYRLLVARIFHTTMKYRAKIDKVVKFIMKRPDEELAVLSVAKLADIFHIERTTLAREFKLHKKVPLAYYLSREKMIRAAFLLGGQLDFSINQIAERMGFSCCQHFNKVFEKFFGTEPYKYKEYQQIRSGVKDRRVGPVERREKTLSLEEIGIPERRKNPGDRRKGVKDRRKSNNVESIPSVSVESAEPGISIQKLLKQMRENGTVEPRTNTDKHDKFF